MARRSYLKIDDGFYRVVEKPTHTVIYKRYGPGPFRDTIVWNSRTKPVPRIGSVLARVLAAGA